MPKTNFVNGNPSQGIQGTVVTAEFLNAINKHRHRGLDEDGDGTLDYAADTGTANSYAIALSPALTAYVTGMPITFKAANANTGSSTLNINALGAVSIKRPDGSSLLANDIRAGQIVAVIYDGASFQMISGFMEGFRGCLVKRTTPQSIPHAVTTLVQWDAEEYDTDNIHDNVINNSRLTVPAGVTKVRLTANTIWTAEFSPGVEIPSGPGGRLCNFYKNGLPWSFPEAKDRRQSALDSSANLSSPVISVTGGDYFEMVVRQDSGGPINLGYTGGQLLANVWFAMEIVK